VKRALYVLYNVAVVAVLFFASELTVRICAPEIRTQGMTRSIVADSIYYATAGLRPLSSGITNGAPVSVDRYGFRKTGSAIDTTKACWLFLGDSVTFGVGIEDDSTFAALVQSRIDSLNILNPSTSGYHIDNYWDVFRCLVLENRHNLVISRVSLFWCLNDIYTDVSDYELPGGSVRYVLSDFLTFIRVHSRLYFYLKNLVFDRSKSYFLFDKSFYDVENPGFHHAMRTIREMNDVCREMNVSFDLCLVPYEYQLRAGDFTPQNLMMEVLGNHVNIHDPFHADDDMDFDSKAYYLYGDGIHLSDRGHSYLAEFLYEST
jgi:hypothetical protein